MRRPPRIVIVILVVLAAAALWWLFLRPDRGPPPGLAGYIEGESLELASPVAGLVAGVPVERGQRVQAGAALFVMDARTAGAQADEAEAAIAQSETEVAAAEAAWRQAQAQAAAQAATAAEARKLADRYHALRRQDPGALAAQEEDKAEATAEAATAQAEAARRQAAAAQARVATARAGVRRAGAGLAQAGVRVDLLSPKAPSAGRIEQVYFQAGEWAGANQPVVSLLPDDKVKVRFFVPEDAVAAYRPGAGVTFRCDGCGAARRARIDYVSPRAEFTPPVIYSRDSRSRLVFMVEAAPEAPADLTPGLPVEVDPLEAGA